MSPDPDIGEPTDRARRILRALVEHYIREGQPVGSRTLARQSGLSLSPASIRNVMADLEELGFVSAPHTSAGRVPTAKGYRFFVDTLVKLQPLRSRELHRLQAQLEEESAAGSQSLAARASGALSAITSLASVVTLPRQSQMKLRQVEFLPLSDRRVLAILVVNDKEVQNRILQMERDHSADELQRAANFLNEHYQGRELREIRADVVQRLHGMRETMNDLLIDAVAIAQKALDLELEQSGFVISGETKLMDCDELSNVDTLKQLFEAFNEQRDLLRLLDRSIVSDGVQIFIGEESGYQLLDDCSLVTSAYSVDGQVVGVLGVIGPQRMAYERVIPIVDITAKLVGAALNSSH
ncbi:MAG: heat-inducible transcriptional repressor HrcA [Chromatiales bacterium]|nr:MAG: heat-inducible transcriptional repressor HrcA [Chromatiales bacterium]